MKIAATEVQDNRDSRQGQWQIWWRTSVLEYMWDNRYGGDGDTGR